MEMALSGKMEVDWSFMCEGYTTRGFDETAAVGLRACFTWEC